MAQIVSTALVLSFAFSTALTSHQRVPRLGSAATSMSIEVESLAGAAQVTQGAAGPQDMRPFGTGWSGDAQLFWGGAQIGSELRLLLTSPATGRYEIFLHFTRAPDYAFAQASFDGAPATSFNGYATSVSRDRAFLGMLDLKPGTHELLIKVTMKDGPSKGLNVGLDRIEFVPVSTSRPGAAPEGRPGFAGVGGSMTQPVEAAIVAGGTPAIPVMHAESRAPVPTSAAEDVVPSPMAMRLAVVKQATSQPVTNPGKPIRLSAETPVAPEATLDTTGSFRAYVHDGEIHVVGDDTLQLNYRNLELKKPHLLECGVLPHKDGVTVEILTYAKTQKTAVSTVVVPGSARRVMAVVVPESNYVSIQLKSADGKFFVVRWCELTPFH